MRIPVLGLFALFLCSVVSFDLEDPKEDGVTFGDKTSTAQLISMIEDNNNTIRKNIVLVTGANEEITVNSNNKDLLQIDTTNSGSDIYVSVVALDYEKITTKSFPIDIIEGNDLNTRQTISLSVVNTDDESPALSTSACMMNENANIDVDSSTCLFTVSDPDGWLEYMDYSAIYGNNGESDLFDFAYKGGAVDNTTSESDVFLVLKPGQTLDYETTMLFTFHVNATDAYGHQTAPLVTVPVIVQVVDQPDELPRWGSGFKSAATITEKTESTIEVSATDGDIGINNEINYEITNTSLEGAVSIDQKTGVISIESINRDEGNDQVIFSVKAYEVPEPESFIIGTITLIVEDQDDNVAEIKVVGSDDKKIDIEVDEGTIDLNLDIVASDIDLGENAIYNATLEFTTTDFSSGFTIIPGRGYESTSLTLTILDPKKLDYEDPDWRVITMELVTTGTKTPTNIDNLPITITLKDINDESPIFQPDEYSVTIPETTKAGTIIKNIQATDLDQEDIDAGLKHELIGNYANSILTIEDLGGNITTNIDNAFDYEKQEEVIVQIRATDNNNHVTTAQLTITVEDINDEKPKMVVSSSITVVENQADGFVLDSQISASDEDNTSDLEFSIDWTNSYATKNSQRLKQEVFDTIHCINVETVPDPDNSKVVTAKLSIKETQKASTPDYEVFDNLYITLVVTDKNQEEGDGTDSALIVISIQDENDNAPVFPEGTETVKRQVTENAALGTGITSPVATDADIGNNLTYSIESADADTPKDWVTIDPTTGIIEVSYDKIDCDDPKRDSLKYTVTVTDGKHETPVTITVDIIDTNDNAPTMDDYTKHIAETPNGDNSANGSSVVILEPKDIDRDEAYHTVACSFAPSTTLDVTNRFMIVDNEIKVFLLEGVDLDRETLAEFVFDLNCYDDPQRQGPTSNPISPPPRITIILDDINDNAPTINNTVITGKNENTAKNTKITLSGKDEDAPDTPNSQIEFVKISKIQRNVDGIAQNDPPQDLFVIETGDNNEGILTLNLENLRNYYGNLVLTISLTDKGESPLTSDVDVTIEVAKYNFEEPAFISPKEGKTYYLQPEQTPYTALLMFDGITYMDAINATDQQGQKFLLDLKIVKDDADLFYLKSSGNSIGELQMKTSSFEKQLFPLTINATISDAMIQGSAAFSKIVTFNMGIFDKIRTDPIFTNHEGRTNFTENQKGLTYQVENATYSDKDLPDDLPVYYLLKTGDESIFELDQKTGLLTLKQELDYEQTQSYDLVIQSSNGPAIKPDAIEDTRFYLTVDVGDANDNAPVFTDKKYIGMMLTVSDTTDSSVVKVQATDADTTSQGKLVYSITKTTGSNPDLIALGNAFKIDSSNGDIAPIFTQNAKYSGYFTLDVSVTDEAPENNQDTAQVNIYLVTDSNLVKFTFENDLDTVSNLRENATAVLDEIFKNESYVSKVLTPTQGDPVNDNPRTNAPIYFVKTTDNSPVESSNIYQKVTDTNFFRQLQRAFLAIGLSLQSFDSEADTTDNMEETLKAWLIGVAVVLGSLCLILLIAFILKTRTLNQRIDKLSNTKFGSQESGLNRTGVTAPTTNKHAVEGSNPVYNNEIDTKDIDRRSVTSGDSDLIGVEDDEKFNVGDGERYNIEDDDKFNFDGDGSMNRENVIE